MLDKLKEGLLFQPLTQEEKEKRGILGRLYGPIASFKVGTRNGRMYNESLWEKVFQNDIVKELFANGGIPGEIQHPSSNENREETDTTKIAVMMPEPPKKDSQGHLVGYFDIIDTPCGKIAVALAKYGFRFGVSSRGTGDVVTDDNGNESVDPNTYNLNAFDLVLIPACADARMTFQESYNPNGNKMKKELFNDINNAEEEEQKVMLEALNELGIDYKPEWIATGTESADNIRDDVSIQLQESLKENQSLRKQIKELNAKLSVGYIEDDKAKKVLEEAMNSVKQGEEKISELDKENKSLRESLKEIKDVQRKLTEKVRCQADEEEKIKTVQSRVNVLMSENQSLREGLEVSKKNLEVAQNTITKQKSSLMEQLDAKDSQIKKLEESIKKDSEVYKESLGKAQNLIEKYKKMSRTAIDGYIEIKANMIGASPEQVKQRLGESYTFKDIDTICGNLASAISRRNSLPFNIDNTSRKVVIPTSKPKTADDAVKDIFSYSDWQNF